MCVYSEDAYGLVTAQNIVAQQSHTSSYLYSFLIFQSPYFVSLPPSLQPVEVPTMLSELRQQRMLMVQTISQYKFVYQVLIQFLKNSRLIWAGMLTFDLTWRGRMELPLQWYFELAWELYNRCSVTGYWLEANTEIHVQFYMLQFMENLVDFPDKITSREARICVGLYRNWRPFLLMWFFAPWVFLLDLLMENACVCVLHMQVSVLEISYHQISCFSLKRWPAWCMSHS